MQVHKELLEAIGELALAIEPHHFDQGKRKRIAEALNTLVEHIIAYRPENPDAQ